jgi:8-oxo-dGTP diphosphatase
MNQEVQRPKVGVGVMILRDGKVLLGKRKSSHGAGTYSFTGGHLEYMESFEDCARRETREECGIEIKNIRFLHVANVVSFTPKHYVNVSFIAEWESGEPQVLEPEKFEDWKWYDLDSLPSPLFKQSALGIQSYTMKNNYYDKE